jgi:hypothetical protein
MLTVSTSKSTMKKARESPMLTEPALNGVARRRRSLDQARFTAGRAAGSLELSEIKSSQDCLVAGDSSDGEKRA